MSIVNSVYEQVKLPHASEIELDTRSAAKA